MSSPVVALFFPLLLSAADAFNITNILSTFPEFTTFNNCLIQTGVAGEINSKQTATVLLVANGNMSAVNGQSPDAIKKTLSVHVILDFYDEARLQDLRAKTVTLTTLYQQSGLAQNQQGFMNVTHVGNGPVAFGSAAPGSTSTAPPSPPAPGPKVSPTTSPTASPPRKALAPANKESPAASPPNTSNTNAPSAGSASIPVADGPGSDDKSSAVSVTSGNYLIASILMIFTSAWFLHTMI